MLIQELLHVSSDEGIRLGGKCAAVRHATKWVLDLVGRPMVRDGSDWGEARYAVAWGLNEYYDVLHTGGEYLTDEEYERMHFGMFTALANYYYLRVHTLLLYGRTPTTLRRWKPKPKNHQWVHLVEDQVGPTRRNPITTWCYMDEDFVGRMKRLILKCHRSSCAEQSMKKYMLWMSICLAEVRDGCYAGPHD